MEAMDTTDHQVKATQEELAAVVSSTLIMDRLQLREWSNNNQDNIGCNGPVVMLP